LILGRSASGRGGGDDPDGILITITTTIPTMTIRQPTVRGTVLTIGTNWLCQFKQNWPTKATIMGKSMA
jgi:pyruvate-formate lyase-activating enzyme